MSKRPEFRQHNRLQKLPGGRPGAGGHGGIVLPNGAPATAPKMNAQHVAVQIIAALAGSLPPGQGVVVGELPDFSAELESMEKWKAEQGEEYVMPPVTAQNLKAVRMLVHWNVEAMAWIEDTKRAQNAKELDPDA